MKNYLGVPLDTLPIIGIMAKWDRVKVKEGREIPIDNLPTQYVLEYTNQNIWDFARRPFIADSPRLNFAQCPFKIKCFRLVSTTTPINGAEPEQKGRRIRC